MGIRSFEKTLTSCGLEIGHPIMWSGLIWSASCDLVRFGVLSCYINASYV